MDDIYEFKSNRSLQEQSTWQDIEALQWQGDEKLQWFCNRWKLLTTSLSITSPESCAKRQLPINKDKLETPTSGHCRV